MFRLSAPRYFVPGTAALLLMAAAALLPSHPAATIAAAGNCDVDRSHLVLDPEEQLVLDQTNAYRASYGLPALRADYALTQSALWKSADMAAQAYFQHDDLFRSWSQRMADCGYNTAGQYVGENLAAGNGAGPATLQQWKDSPPHNQNLLNPNFTAIGIKRVLTTRAGDAYGWYWSMELGSAVDYDLTAWLNGQ